MIFRLATEWGAFKIVCIMSENSQEWRFQKNVGSARPNAGRAELFHIAVRPPSRCHGLPLRVEVHASLAVEVEVSKDGFLVAGEGELGQRDGDRHVHPNCPASIESTNFLAAPPLRVKIAVPFPNWLALMKSMASSKDSASTQQRTGPKIS